MPSGIFLNQTELAKSAPLPYGSFVVEVLTLRFLMFSFYALLVLSNDVFRLILASIWGCILNIVWAESRNFWGQNVTKMKPKNDAKFGS